MLKLVKRGNRWYIIGTVFGERVRRSTGLEASQYEEAFAVLSSVSQELIDRHVHGINVLSRKGFDELLSSYRTRPEGISGRQEYYLSRYEAFFGSKPLADITGTDADAFVERHYSTSRKAKASPSTIYRDLRQLRAVLNYAVQLGWLSNPPRIRIPQVDDKRTTWLTQDQISMAIEIAKAQCPYFKPLLVFLVFTGARLGEALRLEWQEIDLHNN